MLHVGHDITRLGLWIPQGVQDGRAGHLRPRRQVVRLLAAAIGAVDPVLVPLALHRIHLAPQGVVAHLLGCQGRLHVARLHDAHGDLPGRQLQAQRVRDHLQRRLAAAVAATAAVRQQGRH